MAVIIKAVQNQGKNQQKDNELWSLETGKSKIKVLVKQVSFRGLVPWLAGGCHLAVCSHALSFTGSRGQREGKLSGVPSYKDTSPSRLGLHPQDLI